jgi:NRAMP (natural resistance-associated macrophage protein)-like metal ion transporter
LGGRILPPFSFGFLQCRCHPSKLLPIATVHNVVLEQMKNNDESEDISSDASTVAAQLNPPPKKFFRLLGPGLLTGASDDDPSGIATYSQAGAQFGYDMSWSLFFTYPLMCAIQRISAEIGRVTGKGLAGNIRECYPSQLLALLLSLLFIANTINLGADLGAMGAALELLIGGPIILYVIAFAIISALLQVFMRYARYVAILKWLTLSLFAYVATIFFVQVPWGEVLQHTLAPNISLNAAYLTTLVAVFGTTISPYLFFWQAEEEVEDQRADRNAEPLKLAPEQAPAELKRIRLDTYVGMGLSNLIALCIVITAAATLHANGITDVETSAQAAEALRPIAGPFAFTLFALGIIGTGLLAIPVLAASAAYALGEARGWPVGLNRKPREAKAFYVTIVISTLIGIGVNLASLDPVKALFWSAVINGVVAVPIMVMMMLLAMRYRTMGRFVIGRGLALIGWLATLVMSLATSAMIITWFR